MANTSILDNAVWALRASQTYVPLPKPFGPVRFVVTCPDAPNTGETQSVNLAILYGDSVVYSEDSGKSSIENQGQSSAGASKHNLKIKLKSAAGKVSLKFGDFPASTSLTLKAYGDFPVPTMWLDRTMAREAVALELWRQVRKDHPAPRNRIAPWYAWECGPSAITGSLLSAARFSCDCFGVELYWTPDAKTSPVFVGQFMLRSDNSNDAYLIDETNPRHYLLQPQHGAGDLWTNPDYLSQSYWEYSSPDVPDNAVAARLLKWFSAVMTGADSWASYPSYLDIDSWIDYVIFCEAVGSFDSITNNVMLVSWSADENSGLWSLCAYDLDESLGVKWGLLGNSPSWPENTGWVTDQDSVWASFSSYFSGRIKDRYAQLRASGILSPKNFTEIVNLYMAGVNPTSVQKDWSLYGSNPVSNLPYIQNWFCRRLAWLDAQWSFSG